MASVTLKGLHLNVNSRNGLFHHYVRRGGPRFATTESKLPAAKRRNLPPALYAAYLDAVAAEKEGRKYAGASALGLDAAAVKASGGLFSELVAKWQASPEWRGYAEKTKARHELYIKIAMDSAVPGRAGVTFRDMPLAAIEQPEARPLFMQLRADYSVGWRRVKSSPELLAKYAARRGAQPPAPTGKGGARELGEVWIDTTTPTPAVREWAERLAAADDLLRSVQACFSWALSQGLIAASPLASINQLYHSNRADLIWTEADLATLHPHASEVVWAAVYLTALTGLAPVDLVALTWGEIDADAIELGRGRSKTGVSVVIPLYAELADWLGVVRSLFVRMTGRQPGAADPVLLNASGGAWTTGALHKSFTLAKSKAGMADSELNFYDLRGTAATRLKAVPLEDAEIAGILGWAEDRVKRIIKRYVDRKTLTRKLADKINTAPRVVAKNG